MSSFFGGQERLREYAERYGISRIDISYLFDKANTLEGSGEQKKIEKLALVGGSPARFSNISTGLELYCLDKDGSQSISWLDFVSMGNLPGLSP